MVVQFSGVPTHGGARNNVMAPADVVVPQQTQNVMVGTEVMEIKVLGAGKEVGRSCCLVKFKGKCIMFDCGKILTID